MTVEHIDFYRQRRAIRFKAGLKADLLETFRQLEATITHHIIAGCAGDPKAAEARAQAEHQRAQCAALLMNITKD
jgi:hypothetical protein